MPQGLGLSQNGQSFELSGQPNESGTFTFTVQASDGGGHVTNKQFSVTISNALQVTTTTLPNGTNGLFYSMQLQATGGVPFDGASPYSWSVSSGSLPADLNLATNGLLSGTLTTVGNFNFNAQATDVIGANNNQGLSLTVVSTNLPPLMVGSSGGMTMIFWPLSYGTNFTVQMTTNLATGPWVPATDGVPMAAFVFTNQYPAAFFRLQP